MDTSALTQLFLYQHEQILEALRRDVRAEAKKAAEGGQWASLHAINARQSISLLEALNPKQRCGRPLAVYVSRSLEGEIVS